MRRALVWVVVVVVLVLVLAGGGIVVVTKSRKEFLSLIEAEVARQLAELRPDLDDAARAQAARIVAAQAGLETNYGRTPAWRQAFNFGNITAGSRWQGPVVLGGDTEPDASGKYVPITQRFRAYGSLAEAVSDYFAFLGSTSGYRAALGQLFAGDAEGFAAALRAAGYYTAPLEDYTAGILAGLGGFA